MKIRIIVIGKLKEKFLQQAMQEYQKRLQPFCSLEICQVNERALPEKMHAAQIEQHLKQEAEAILPLIPKDSHVFLLDLHGVQISSEQLADKIHMLGINGISHLTFIIGGALGLDDTLRQKANFSWSFSKLTFTHQIIRVLLLEQIYRAFKIIRLEPYHW